MNPQTRQDDASKQLITIEDLCERWKVDRQWVYRQTHQGARNPLPVVRLGRLLRFREYELEAWLEAHQETRVH